MVTKGIIKSIDLTGNTCTVHMPFFETAGNDPIIGTAIISNTPGSYNGYKVGDAVLVAFEDGNMESPVIMGKLYLGAEAERADPRGVLNVEASSVSKSASMPADTKLAANIDNNVPNTTVPYNSLSSIANELNSLNVDVREMDRDYGNKYKQTITALDEQKKEVATTIEQTATNIKNEVVHRNSTDQTPEGVDTGFGWELDYDSWRIYKTNNEIQTNILYVDKDGLTVTGKVVAEEGSLGKFTIGKEDSESQNSGIYSADYITKFETTPDDDAKGVYIGTDGIKLGSRFSVDPEGTVTASGLLINKNQVDGLVGELQKVSQEAADAAGVAESAIQKWVKEDVFNKVTETTNIADKWIASTTVLAKNLQVNAAHITGTLTVGNPNTTPLLEVDTKEKKIGIGGFEVSESGMSTTDFGSTYADAGNSDSGVYIGTDGIKLGKNFSVDPSGKVTASTLTIEQSQVDGLDDTLQGCTDNAVNSLNDTLGIEETTITSNGVSTKALLAKNLVVNAAQIKDKLIIGQLPDSLAEKNDIPTSTSELTNDTGFVAESGVVTIVEGTVTAGYVNGLGCEFKKGKIGGWVFEGDTGILRSANGVYGTYTYTANSKDNNFGFTELVAVTPIAQEGYAFTALLPDGLAYIIKDNADYSTGETKVIIPSYAITSFKPGSGGSGGGSVEL